MPERTGYEILLHGQLPDLGMEFLLHLVMSRGIGGSCPKYVLGFGKQLFFSSPEFD